MFQSIKAWQALSFIGPKLKIDGDIHSEGDVKIAGFVNGNVTARSITVSKEGTLHGEAHADTAVIEGALDGSLTAAKVVIGAHAHVNADVTYFSLQMDAGAVFMGRSRRLRPDTTSADSQSVVETMMVPQGEVLSATDPRPGKAGYQAQELGNCPYPILDDTSAEACIEKNLCGCGKGRLKETHPVLETKPIASSLLRTVFTMASRA
ncbi:MAG TPA: polymer-forming cytoskeletal protein [Stellaceae bacterium]|nr:polymer-forming cytoskeletal protein [Stellaceae bacterium]